MKWSNHKRNIFCSVLADTPFIYRYDKCRLLPLVYYHYPHHSFNTKMSKLSANTRQKSYTFSVGLTWSYMLRRVDSDIYPSCWSSRFHGTFHQYKPTTRMEIMCNHAVQGILLSKVYQWYRKLVFNEFFNRFVNNLLIKMILSFHLCIIGYCAK